MTTAALIGVSAAGAALIVAQTVWLKRRVKRASALREQVGPVEVPPRKAHRTIALIVLGMAIIVIGDPNDGPFILGVGVVCTTLVGSSG